MRRPWSRRRNLWCHAGRFFFTLGWVTLIVFGGMAVLAGEEVLQAMQRAGAG